jgi:uncharacterized protein YhaN
VRAILTTAAELEPAIEKRSELATRIREMKNDRIAFTNAVDLLVAELGIKADGRLGPDLAKTVEDRVQAAVRAEAERNELQIALADAQDRKRETQREVRARAHRLGSMMQVLQADSLFEVAEKLRDIRDKAELGTQAAEAEQEILAALYQPSSALTVFPTVLVGRISEAPYAALQR